MQWRGRDKGPSRVHSKLNERLVHHPALGRGRGTHRRRHLLRLLLRLLRGLWLLLLGRRRGLVARPRARSRLSRLLLLGIVAGCRLLLGSVAVGRGAVWRRRGRGWGAPALRLWRPRGRRIARGRRVLRLGRGSRGRSAIRGGRRLRLLVGRNAQPNLLRRRRLLLLLRKWRVGGMVWMLLLLRLLLGRRRATLGHCGQAACGRVRRG